MSILVLFIHFCNVASVFDVVVVGFVWAQFAKAVTAVLVVYRDYVFYTEISQLPEPTDIDFNLLGITFNTFIIGGKFVSVGRGLAGASLIAGLGGAQLVIEHKNTELIKKTLELEEVVKMLADEKAKNQNYMDELNKIKTKSWWPTK
jgi:hypothetical protein